MTGWALFLDYLIVIALSALFLPHYLAGALQVPALERNPWDVIVGVGVIVLVALVRLVRRPSLYGLGIVVPALDLLTQLLARRARVRARLLAARADARDVARHAPDLARARVLAAARDARVHRARDRREPGRGGAPAGRRPAALGVRRRSRPSSRCTSRSPSSRSRRSRGRRPSSARRWIRAPLVGVADEHPQRAAVPARRHRCASTSASPAR